MRRKITTLVLVFAVVILSIFYFCFSRTNISETDDLFLERIKSISYIDATIPFNVKVLKTSEREKLKEILIEKYLNKQFTRGKFDNDLIPLSFRMKTFDGKFVALYNSKTKQLFFNAEWFIEEINSENIGEKIYYTDDMLLDVDDDIDYFLDDIGIKINN